MKIVPWVDAGPTGTQVQTPHYRLFTTVRDADFVARLGRVMENAHAQYVATIPPASGQLQSPLDVYVFEKPAQWEAFTRRLTGAMAPVYLSVGSGGYTYGDKVVCWLFNEADLWSVLAHEGFHQYAARTLPLRLPPALEEGLATTFEGIKLSERQVIFDRRENPRRQRGLSDAVDAKALLPLNVLVRAHAGDIAGQVLVTREAFYAQCWALARLLQETPAYSAALHRLLTDLRDGRATPVVGKTGTDNLYQPSTIRPLMVRYFEKDWAEFETAYARFIATVLPATSGRD